MNSTGSSFWSNGSVPLIEPEILSSIISAASDIALVISQNGVILSVLLNKNDTSFGKLDHWEGRSIHEFLTTESIPKFDAMHARFLKGMDPARSVELNHSDNAVWEFPIRYSFHPFGSEGSILMLGRDLRPIAETQQQLVQAQMSLEQGYEARREFDARYRLLLRTVRDPIVFVSVGDGRIKDLNEPAASLLGSTREDLIESSFAQEFRDRRREEFVEGLINTSISETTAGLEVQTKRNRQRAVITPNVFRAAGERILICRLNLLTDTAAQHDDLSVNLGVLFKRGSDAMVFTSITGVIQTCNDSFLDLVDAAHLVDVKGRNLSEYLGRGQIDMSVLIENARRAGHMRMYSTKVMNDFGAKTAVELSVTYLNDRSEPELGFVIRDASRVDAIRKQPIQTSEESSRNVMELVGSASLKEIVSETTDVVEKMCIETAVNLTRNNRVAAAEMLGLSRQSLYVKLRKYGLLSRDSEDGS
ncbi:transcriptional regulator PpsR [Aestuariicoccus sp. MJ-SS9]|uniref:transcriptional regulator PpsR n=1 Tax=Aestuariicoccus sp. MJ-SS9 TaxID=3079855 RepID=UPI002907F34D|nr:transcriptional regulator PpsR [Aestuariicoccus sp. MJ-SS9]MDU8910951.1 transcriptional regulator PpsR [Aestuariicoccus sp. MJ-SS9]